MYPFQDGNSLKSAPNTVPTTCIALPYELIFVDCGSYPNLSLKFRLDMEKKFQRETTHLLLTHLHWDHFLAIDVFKDVKIVAPELGIPEFKNFKNTISNTEEDKWSSLFLIDEDEIIKTVKQAELKIPNVLVKEELRIGSGDNEIIFRVIGGHSIDSAYIYFPSDKILCSGDNLIECFAQLPGIPQDTLRIFSHWETLDIEKVIPGHGNVVSKNYLLKVKSYFEELISTLKKLIANNIPRREIFTHPSLPKYFALNQPDWTESSTPDMKWIEMTIKTWYRLMKKQ
jgi:glyoxylase-like metal-dependent hydrolase (beta-lactamase superfamily II)